MKFTDDELITAIESEERMSLDSLSGELQGERTEALARYRGEPLGNEIEGRSQIVDKTVLDTIEWIMPSLIRVYMGGDEIGKFEPRGPEDEAAAQAETDCCNWYLEAKNDTFSQLNATLRDALLLKNGYMMAYWQVKKDTMVEEYSGLADEEAAMLMQDPEVSVLEHSERPDPLAPPPMPAPPQPMAVPPMGGMVPPPSSPAMGGSQPPAAPPMPPQPPPQLHDIKVERKTAEEFVAVESVPPDEILVSRRHRWTSLADADFVQWRRRVTIGQLRAEGFKVEDDEPTYEDFNQEWAERQRFRENLFPEDSTQDPTRRVIVFKDTYMRMDLRDTGTPQLWRFCLIAGSTQLILKQEVDIIPFAAFSPIIYPHSHIGSSVFDLIQDIGTIKTVLQRQLLDGVYLAQSGQKVVNINASPNLDDFLTDRPGGIKRVEGPPGDAVMQLTNVDTSPVVLQALDYMDTVNERRTGVVRSSVALDADTLNRTATGVQQSASAANQRIELIARTLASGFKDLFLIIHALALKHSTKPLQMKLKGKWTTVNPREWTRRTDFSISVGLGVGSPEMVMQKLAMLQPVMQAAMGMGLAGPTEAYNFGCEMWKAAGYKEHGRFIKPLPTDPKTGQPMQPPPPPNPLVQVEQIKAQSAGAIAQGKGQLEMAQFQAKQQSEGQQAQMHAQITAAAEKARTDADIVIQQHKNTTNAQLEQFKTEQQLKLEAAKHQMAMESAERIEHIKANAQIEVARINAAIADGANAAAANAKLAGMPEAIDPVKALQPHIDALMKAVTAPRTTQIIRDPLTGKAQGAVSVHPHAQSNTVQ